MSKSNKSSVSPQEFFDYFVSTTKIKDKRDAFAALNVLLGVQKSYATILETLGTVSLTFSSEGLMQIAVTSHSITKKENVDLVLRALNEAIERFTELKKEYYENNEGATEKQ